MTSELLWKLTRLPPYTVAVLVYCHCYCTLTLAPFLPMCPIMCSLVREEGRKEEREGGNDVLHIHFYVLRCLCVLQVSITFILLHNSFTCTYLLHVDSTCIYIGSCSSIYSLSLCDCSCPEALQPHPGGDLRNVSMCVVCKSIRYMYAWDIITCIVHHLFADLLRREMTTLKVQLVEQNKTKLHRALHGEKSCIVHINGVWNRRNSYGMEKVRGPETSCHLSISHQCNLLSHCYDLLSNLRISLPPFFLQLVARLLVMCMFSLTSPFSLLPSSLSIAALIDAHMYGEMKQQVVHVFSPKMLVVHTSWQSCDHC